MHWALHMRIILPCRVKNEDVAQHSLWGSKSSDNFLLYTRRGKIMVKLYYFVSTILLFYTPTPPKGNNNN